MTKKTKIRIALSVLFFVVLAVSFYFSDKKADKLKNSNTTKAILIYIDEYITRGSGAKIEFQINNKKITTDINCDCRKLNIGDTVLIRYAVDDPTIVRMVDKYYEINKGFQKNPKE
jgi:hypothetical protein